MLTINDHVGKLDVARVDFVSWGILTASLFEATLMEPELLDEEDEAEAAGPQILVRKYSWNIDELAVQLQQPLLPELSCHFLYQQLHAEATDQELDNLTVDECPEIVDTMRIFASAVVTFYAPSDISGLQKCATKESTQHQCGVMEPGVETAFLSNTMRTRLDSEDSTQPEPYFFFQ
ncbi:hypothetical protein C8J56DRAFT_879534 [Mycena floridula]|nr:hypothetical protein C8J56DRAFT_879534 [Mycena floridula]